MRCVRGYTADTGVAWISRQSGCESLVCDVCFASFLSKSTAVTARVPWSPTSCGFRGTSMRCVCTQDLHTEVLTAVTAVVVCRMNLLLLQYSKCSLSWRLLCSTEARTDKFEADDGSTCQWSPLGEKWHLHSSTTKCDYQVFRPLPSPCCCVVAVTAAAPALRFHLNCSTFDKPSGMPTSSPEGVIAPGG